MIFAALQLLVVSGFLNLTRVLLGLKPAANDSRCKHAAAFGDNNSLSLSVLMAGCLSRDC